MFLGVFSKMVHPTKSHVIYSQESVIFLGSSNLGSLPKANQSHQSIHYFAASDNDTYYYFFVFDII